MSSAEGMRKNRGGLLAWGGLGVVVALIVLFGALKKPPEKTAVEPEKPVAAAVPAPAPAVQATRAPREPSAKPAAKPASAPASAVKPVPDAFRPRPAKLSKTIFARLFQLPIR